MTTKRVVPPGVQVHPSSLKQRIAYKGAVVLRYLYGPWNSLDSNCESSRARTGAMFTT